MYDEYILRSPDDADAGGDTTPDDGDGGGDGGVAAPARPDFSSFVLDGDDVPSKLRGKTGSDLLKSYENLSQMTGKQAAELKELKKQVEAAGERGIPDGFFPNLMASARKSGKLDPAVAEQAAGLLGATVDDLGKLASLIHEDVARTISRAQDALGDEFKVDVQELIDAAQKSGIYKAHELEAFDVMIQRGSVEPFRVMAKDLEEAGFDLSDLGSKPEGKTMGGVPPRKGKIAGSADQGYTTRREYIDARIAAGSDPQKQREVAEKLKRSKVDRWPDRGFVH